MTYNWNSYFDHLEHLPSKERMEGESLHSDASYDNILSVELIPMTREYVSDIVYIQKQSYSKVYHESIDAFLNMIDSFSSGCYLLQVTVKDNNGEGTNRKEIAGYIISHPYVRGQIQKLNSGSLTITGKEDCWYIHDCCLALKFQRKGLSKIMIQNVEQMTLSKGLDTICLVSVQNTFKFWERLGFKIKKELFYGDLPSYLMEKDLRSISQS
jgi:ribosomal protein S18 acetylase RimI-like enzyme